MDIKPIFDKVTLRIKNYRFAILIAALGFLLMILPTSGKKKVSTPINMSEQTVQYDVEEQLREILSKINGVGDVQVLLTVESEGETVYQNDREERRTDSDWEEQLKTVILTDSDRNQIGLVRMKIAPVYRGAIVVCEGGDLPSVQLAVTQVVIRATGLKADQVCVVKMK